MTIIIIITTIVMWRPVIILRKYLHPCSLHNRKVMNFRSVSTCAHTLLLYAKARFGTYICE